MDHRPSDLVMSALVARRSGFSECTDMIRSGSSFSRSMFARNTCVPDDRRIRHGVVGRRQVEHVRVGQDLFLRQVHHQHAVGVRQAHDVVDLDRARRRPGTRACRATDSTFGFLPDFDIASGASVRGALSAVRRNALLTSCVTIVAPSATTAGRPLV